MISYWNKYYTFNKSPVKPSNFAKFCKKHLKNFSGTIYDVGCGNGRDTIYFNKNNISCIGIDSCSKIIRKNKFKYNFLKNNFQRKDFSKIIFLKKKEDIAIYSRFSLHSINLKSEKNFFKNIQKSKNVKLIMIEVRTIYDQLFGKGKKIGKNEFVTSHYRRFIIPNNLKKEIIKSHRIKFFKLDKNFAKFKKENPIVLRIIGERKK
tara:strand:+ start:721 stop:1338 length:618 start_codon:yes stop_codon:yes gene_type:complete